MITAFVKGQKLELTQPLVVSDTIDYLEAVFHFQTADWVDRSVWAHFAQPGDQYKEPVNYVINLRGGKILPSDHLNLGAGTWEIYLHGTAPDGSRITTNVQTLTVEKTGPMDGEPLGEIPPSAAEQLDARVTKLEQEGPSGPSGPSDAVRYGPQELTDEQKEQARKNIGAGSVTDLSAQVEAAQAAARDAGQSASNAAGSAQSASTDAGRAEAAQSAANGSAVTAQGHAESAAGSAQQASTQAGNASGAAKTAKDEADRAKKEADRASQATPKLKPLTFTGASTAEYDGTKPVSVDIETAYPISEESASTLELAPNVYHKWGVMVTLSITLGAETPGVVNEFCGEFVSGTEPTNFSVPGSIKWVSELKIEASKKYQFSIVDGIGVIAGA